MVALDRSDICGEGARVLNLVPPFVNELLDLIIESTVKRESARAWFEENAFVGSDIDGLRYIVNTQLVYGGMRDTIRVV